MTDMAEDKQHEEYLDLVMMTEQILSMTMLSNDDNLYKSKPGKNGRKSVNRTLACAEIRKAAEGCGGIIINASGRHANISVKGNSMSMMMIMFVIRTFIHNCNYGCNYYALNKVLVKEFDNEHHVLIIHQHTHAVWNNIKLSEVEG